MPNILIAGELHPSGLEIIKQNPKFSIDYLKEVSNENFLPYLKNADALIIRTQTLKKNHIEKAKKLKIVSSVLRSSLFNESISDCLSLKN